MKNARITLRSSCASNEPTRSAATIAPARPVSSHGSRCRNRWPIDSTLACRAAATSWLNPERRRQVFVVLGGQDGEHLWRGDQAEEATRVVYHREGVAAAVDGA